MRITLFIITVLLLYGCTKSLFQSKWTTEKSPASFVARFETSKGSFDVEVNRKWSPAAVDRFYQLVKCDFYNNALFYRAVPNFPPAPKKVKELKLYILNYSYNYYLLAWPSRFQRCIT